jgi:hypothetical protein
MVALVRPIRDQKMGIVISKFNQELNGPYGPFQRRLAS